MYVCLYSNTHTHIYSICTHTSTCTCIKRDKDLCQLYEYETLTSLEHRKSLIVFIMLINIDAQSGLKLSGSGGQMNRYVALKGLSSNVGGEMSKLQRCCPWWCLLFCRDVPL